MKLNQSAKRSWNLWGCATRVWQ